MADHTAADEDIEKGLISAILITIIVSTSILSRTVELTNLSLDLILVLACSWTSCLRDV